MKFFICVDATVSIIVVVVVSEGGGGEAAFIVIQIELKQIMNE